MANAPKGMMLHLTTLNVSEKIIGKVFPQIVRGEAYYMLLGGIAYSIERALANARAHGVTESTIVLKEVNAILKNLRTNKSLLKRFLEEYDSTFVLDPTKAKEKKILPGGGPFDSKKEAQQDAGDIKAKFEKKKDGWHWMSIGEEAED